MTVYFNLSDDNKKIIESLNNFTDGVDSDIRAEFKFNIINDR